MGAHEKELIGANVEMQSLSFQTTTTEGVAAPRVRQKGEGGCETLARTYHACPARRRTLTTHFHSK